MLGIAPAGVLEVDTTTAIIAGVTRSDWYELRIQYNLDTNAISWDYRLDGAGTWTNIATHTGNVAASFDPAGLATEMTFPGVLMAALP